MAADLEALRGVSRGFVNWWGLVACILAELQLLQGSREQLGATRLNASLSLAQHRLALALALSRLALLFTHARSNGLHVGTVAAKGRSRGRRRGRDLVVFTARLVDPLATDHAQCSDSSSGQRPQGRLRRPRPRRRRRGPQTAPPDPHGRSPLARTQGQAGLPLVLERQHLVHPQGVHRPRTRPPPPHRHGQGPQPPQVPARGPLHPSHRRKVDRRSLARRGTQNDETVGTHERRNLDRLDERSVSLPSHHPPTQTDTRAHAQARRGT